MSSIPADDPTTRLFLRHTLATIAYRTGKAIRDAPEEFGGFRATPESPRSVTILAHMGDLMDWVRRMLEGEWRWLPQEPLPWPQEVARFFDSLKSVDDYLATGSPIRWDPGRVFQGGIADALTHTGQLAMLRRLAGCKIKGENYARAAVEIGRVGLDQTPPEATAEFD